VDSTGAVYADGSGNNYIARVLADGGTAVLAGDGNHGDRDTSAGPPEFGTPHGLAVGGGVIYVADTDNGAIRAVSPANGNTTTFAGGFGKTMGVAVDGAGNVYVADATNNCIRAVTPNGEGSTLAGSCSDATDGGPSILSSPVGVAVDGAGNVYVADTGNNCIRKVTLDGGVTTLAGMCGKAGGVQNGPGGSARFNGPSGVAVDRCRLIVGDTNNGLIRVVQL
jgi:sugar lactone lactonase YvrE